MGRAAAGAAVLALTDQAAAPVRGGQRIGYHCHLADSYVYYTILLAFLTFNTIRVKLSAKLSFSTLNLVIRL